MTDRHAPNLVSWLIAAALAMMSCAVDATEDCKTIERVDPIPSPPSLVGLGNLPQVPADWPDATRAPPIHALTEASKRFADRAPAWSLAVASPRLGLWQAHIGDSDNARFAAASIGKSMTAVLVFRAIEAGLLSLTDPIDRWFPDLPAADQVTIEHLLTHRSGYFIPADGPLSGPYQAPEKAFEKLQKSELAFCPGQGWAYSNVAYQLLGRIIEGVSGQSYADQLHTEIIEPLALTNTKVLRPNTADPLLVQGHHAGQPVGPVDYASAFAAAPVVSTAPDLLRYWRALLGNELVSQASLERMIDPAWPMFGDPQMRYGAGIQVAEVPGPGLMLMHSGGITGFSATVAWLLDHDVWVAVMTNEKQVPAEAAMWALAQALNSVEGQSRKAHDLKSAAGRPFAHIAEHPPLQWRPCSRSGAPSPMGSAHAPGAPHPSASD